MDSGHRSRAFRLKRAEPLGQGLRRIAVGRAENALERLRGVAPGDDEFGDAVHETRKDLKKLRAIARLARHRLGGEEYEEQNRCYRDAARALSESRDAQVKLETLEALAERFPSLPPGALAAWREALKRDCDRTLEETDAMTVFEAIDLIEAGRDRIEDWDLGEGSWQLIDPGIRRTHRQGRRAMRRAEAEPSEESFHRWRKRAKDLWYLLRILCDAWPELLEPSAEQAHRLTKLLGDHHDLAMLRGDLADRQLADENREALAGAISTYEDELAAAALELGSRLYAEKPKAFSARLRAYWEAWGGATDGRGRSSS